MCMSILDSVGPKPKAKPEESKKSGLTVRDITPFEPKPFTMGEIKRQSDGRKFAKGTAPGPGRPPGPQGLLSYMRKMTDDGRQLVVQALEALGGYLRLPEHPVTGEPRVLTLGYKEIADARNFLADRGLLPKQAHITHEVNRTDIEVKVYQLVAQRLTPEELEVYAKIETLATEIRRGLNSGTTTADVVDGEVIT